MPAEDPVSKPCVQATEMADVSTYATTPICTYGGHNWLVTMVLPSKLSVTLKSFPTLQVLCTDLSCLVKRNLFAFSAKRIECIKAASCMSCMKPPKPTTIFRAPGTLFSGYWLPEKESPECMLKMQSPWPPVRTAKSEFSGWGQCISWVFHTPVWESLQPFAQFFGSLRIIYIFILPTKAMCLLSARHWSRAGTQNRHLRDKSRKKRGNNINYRWGLDTSNKTNTAAVLPEVTKEPWLHLLNCTWTASAHLAMFTLDLWLERQIRNWWHRQPAVTARFNLAGQAYCGE